MKRNISLRKRDIEILDHIARKKWVRFLREKGFFVRAEAIEPDPLREKWNHDSLVNKVKNILLKSSLVEVFFSICIKKEDQEEEMRQKLIAQVESLKKNNFLIKYEKRKNRIYFTAKKRNLV